jgi:hypothetical protein
MAQALREQAVQVSDHLVAAVPSVDAVCLYGSVARGDEHEGSDVDLLVLGSDPTLTPSRLREFVPSGVSSSRVMFTYHTPQTLALCLRRWSRFGAHVRREGEILFDRWGKLREALHEEVPVCTREELAAQLRHLRNFDDPSRFGGYFLFALARLYSVGRTVVFALLAEHGELEFDQRRAMTLLEQMLPEASDEISAIERLRPFQELVSGRGESCLPFSPRDCETELTDARDAVRKLIARSELISAGVD